MNLGRYLKQGQWVYPKLVEKDGALFMTFGRKFPPKKLDINYISLKRPETKYKLVNGKERIKEAVNYEYGTMPTPAQDKPLKLPKMSVWRSTYNHEIRKGRAEHPKPATKKQTFALYRFIGVDYRTVGLTRDQADMLIRGCLRRAA